MMARKVLYFMLVFGGAIILSISESLTNSSAAPAGNTGSPGDNGVTCARTGCHVGIVNSGSGTLTIDLSSIPTQGYRPGETYNITVTMNEIGRTKYGFQLVAEDQSKNKVGAFVGNGTVKILVNRWITHNKASVSGVWTFGWTAPQNVGNITFYAAGNAANSNGTATGDRIYTTHETVTVDPFAGIDQIQNPEDVKINYDYFNRTIRINTHETFELGLYNLGGKLILKKAINPGDTEISLSVLKPGIYVVKSVQNEISSTLVVY